MLKYIITSIGSRSAWFDEREHLVGKQLPDSARVGQSPFDPDAQCVEIPEVDGIHVPGVLDKFTYCCELTLELRSIPNG